MKKKIIFTLLIFVLAFISVFSIVKATNEDNGIMLINQNRMLGYEQIEDKDVYEATANIERKSQVINGNTYFCANNVMLSDVVINGDAFIVANTVTFENGTTINGNLFICASNVKIDGSYIERSIFAAVKDITFTETSSITYDANIIASHVIVNGTFDRNLNMAVDDIEVKERANILGTMNYTSNKEAVVEEGALIQDINFDKHVEEHETVLDVIIRYVLDFVRYFVLTMVIFILIMKFTPRFLEKVDKLFGITSFGIGILSIILIPLLILALLLIRVGATLAVVLALCFVLMFVIANSISVIAISDAISRKIKKVKLPILVVLTTIVTWVLFKVPVIGGILSFLMISTGIGMLLKYQFVKNK